MDYNIKLNDGQILKGSIRSPGNNLRAVIIMVHGLGEHIQRYDLWSDYFVNKNTVFTGVDLPGHGRTGGKRGHVKSFSVFNEIIDVLIKESKKTFPGIPIVLYGHSLGGLIVLHYLLTAQPSIIGAVVTSPFLRLAFEPDKAKLKLASIVKYFWPGLLQPTLLVTEHLSHDPEVVKNYINDPLVHGKVSVGLFTGMMKSASYCLSHSAEVKVPLLLLHGSDDLICSPAGSREFAEKSSLTELKIWEGGYHELHNEPFRVEVFTFILNWMNSRLKL